MIADEDYDELAQEIYANELGYAAGYNDVYPSCPYPKGSPSSDAWWDGYEEGYYDG